MEQHETLNRWSEYIEELFDDDGMPKPSIQKTLEGSSMIKDEVRQAINSMKNNKATSPGGILIEMIQSLGEVRAC